MPGPSGSLRAGDRPSSLLWARRRCGTVPGMDFEDRLIEKLRRIEALFEGATTEGERTAAGEAAKRVRARLEEIKQADPPVEYRFSISDPWSRMLFVALARRYGLAPFRHRGQRRTSVMVKVPRSFAEKTLIPEFRELEVTLIEHLSAVADRVIRQVINPDVAEAPEVEAPKQLPPGAREQP